MTNELVSVDEPSMCAYRMVFRTPAACDSRYGRELNLELDPAQAQ